MSSMYRYCAFQFSEEFSALETSSIAISFFTGSLRSLCEPGCVGEGDGLVGVGVGLVGVGVGLPPGSVPYTLNSNSEYPYAVPRLVPSSRTYRPSPDRPVRSSVAPLPVVVL